MLTIAHTVTSNTGLAGKLLAVYQHGSLPLWWVCKNGSVCEDVEKGRRRRRAVAEDADWRQMGRRSGCVECPGLCPNCVCAGRDSVAVSVVTVALGVVSRVNGPGSQARPGWSEEGPAWRVQRGCSTDKWARFWVNVLRTGAGAV
jgi:hypothetical protein